MADIRELRTQFTATAKGLKATFKDVRNEIRQLSPTTDKTVSEVNKSYQKLEKQTDELRKAIKESDDPKAFDDLNKAIDKTQQELKDTGRVTEEAMNELRTAVQKSGGSFDKLSADGRQAMDKVSKSVDSLESDLKKLGKDSGLDELNDGMEDLDSNIKEAGSNQNVGGLAAIGGALGTMRGKTLAAAGGVVALGTGIIGLIKSGSEMQGALNSLQQQTGATDEEMKGMRDSLEDIYAAGYGDNFQDIANAMASVEGATELTGAELEEATKQALLLRDAFNWDVDESIRAARVMMSTFGYTAEESFSILAQGRQELGSSADDLLDTFNEYGHAFNDLGFDGEDAMNMIISSVREGARDTDRAADSVNEFATRIRDGSDLTRESLQMAGLDADAIIAKFDEGGESGKEAFGQVVEAIGGIGNASKQEQAAVGLFGTMVEDIGVDAVLALGNVDGQVDKTADTMAKLDELKFNSIGGALEGVGRIISTEIFIPMQNKIMPTINDVVTGFRDKLPGAIDAVKGKFREVGDALKPLQEFLGGIFELFRNNDGKAVSMLASLGLSADEIKAVMSVVDTLQERLSRMRDWVVNAFQSMGDNIKNVWNNLLPFIRPALNSVLTFVTGIFKKIATFWNENGSQILQAAQNLFNGIMAVVKFVMPVVLGIIKSVWGNIKGVINGALNVIMGAIKVFSGLFTGDFKKMWEGIKQMFKGAIEFVWNYIQLLFIGRILKGAKAFATTFKSGLQTMWQGIVALFKGSITTAWNLVKTGWTTIWNVTKSLFTNIWNFLKNTWQTIRNVFSSAINFLKKAIDVGWNAISGTTLRVFRGIWDFLKNTWNTIKNFMSNSVSTILTKVRNTWNSLWGSTKDIFRKIYNGIKDRFTDIVNAAKNLPKRIGDGIGNMASKVTSGVTKVINKLASILGKGVNGVIGGINWVLGKIGVDTKIPKWDVPQWGTGSSGSKDYGPRATGVQNYAYGTKGNGHKGGMALVGDGKGSNAGQELIQTPDGRTMLSPGTDTLVDLPKGTRVWSATDTRKLLSQIPGYAWGTETLKKTGSAIKTGAQKTGSAIKKGAEVTWDATKTAGGAVKDLAFDVWDYVSDPKKLLEKTLAGLGVKKPSMDGLLGNIAGGGFSMIKDKAVSYLKEKLKPFKDGGGGSYMGTGNVPGNVKSWISAAIARTGVPSSWLGALTTIAMKESGGRTGPETINKWDINWKRGTPSMGLMQTIRPTFDAYKEAGWNDIMNPIHNAAAAINYIKARYGNVNNVPGIRALREGRAYVGYADGGIVDTAQLAWIAEGGWAESIISHDPAKRNSQRAIWEQTGKELGFSSSDGAIKQLLEEIRDGVIAGHNLEVLMNDRVVGKILEPHITEFQNRKENTQKKFRKGVSR